MGPPATLSANSRQYPHTRPPGRFPGWQGPAGPFRALAWAEVLVTLARGDFASLLGTSFDGLLVLKPGDFLKRERAAGRLI